MISTKLTTYFTAVNKNIISNWFLGHSTLKLAKMNLKDSQCQKELRKRRQLDSSLLEWIRISNEPDFNLTIDYSKNVGRPLIWSISCNIWLHIPMGWIISPFYFKIMPIPKSIPFDRERSFGTRINTKPIFFRSKIPLVHFIQNYYWWCNQPLK